METKAQLEYDTTDVLYCDDNRAYRKERVVSGVLSMLLGAALAALGLPYFAGQWLYQTPIAVAATGFILIGIAQIIVSCKLAAFPHACVIDMRRIVIREKRRYHYIDFCELGVVRFHCKTLHGGCDGIGLHRIEIIDGAVYYYIGELKKRIATRDADKIAFIIDHRIKNDAYRDWGRVYDNALSAYKKSITESDKQKPRASAAR